MVELTKRGFHKVKNGNEAIPIVEICYSLGNNEYKLVWKLWDGEISCCFGPYQSEDDARGKIEWAYGKGYRDAVVIDDPCQKGERNAS
jgi:hypothetical protein